MVSGFAQLPLGGKIWRKPPYAALVDFYDDMYQGQRSASPCCSRSPAPAGAQRMVVIVAETLELRQTLARKISIDTLWRQLIL
jgi:two-component system sensor histidine kinase TctE